MKLTINTTTIGTVIAGLSGVVLAFNLLTSAQAAAVSGLLVAIAACIVPKGDA